MSSTQNYTIGRGEVFFSQFAPGTLNPQGERYFGNTPTFNIAVEATNLDHYSSDRGVREKDMSVVNQLNRTGNLVTDSIRPENVALFFFGSKEALVVSSATSQSDTFLNVKKDLFYQLGVAPGRMSGVRGVTNVVVKSSGASPTTFVLGTDYVVDANRGRIQLVPTGSIPDASSITVTYDILASTRTRLISGNKPIEGQLRYIAHNPEGDDYDYFMPYVKIRPNGDYNLKSDEWQQLPLMVEILKPTVGEAIYMDGQPAFA